LKNPLGSSKTKKGVFYLWGIILSFLGIGGRIERRNRRSLSISCRLEGVLLFVMKDKIQILVLDDESIVCDRLKSSLEKLGFYVETFTESQAALDRFAEHHFHIVITDLKMNAPDGMDVLRFVRENSPGTRVIIVTGFATVEKAREAIKSGAADFIAKPFKMSELRDIVLRLAREIQTGMPVSESRSEDASR